MRAAGVVSENNITTPRNPESVGSFVRGDLKGTGGSGGVVGFRPEIRRE